MKVKLKKKNADIKLLKQFMKKMYKIWQNFNPRRLSIHIVHI